MQTFEDFTGNTRQMAHHSDEAGRRHDRMFFRLIVLITISAVLILGTGYFAFANSGQNSAVMNKYYTSIEIVPGDTLWSLAVKYTSGTDVSVSEYLEEIRLINHLSDEHLMCGGYLVVPYYCSETTTDGIFESNPWQP